MSDESVKWDAQWSKLLTHCHGEVEANPQFRSDLLTKLKANLAERGEEERSEVEPAVAESSETDRNWSRLFSAAYVPCEPDVRFQANLVAILKAKQAECHAPAPSSEEEHVQTLLTTSYHPVTPRREFETRLLENLKERQRETQRQVRISRRRTMRMSIFSSLAAAAVVLFAVWVIPPGTFFTPAAGQPGAFVAQLPVAADILESGSNQGATPVSSALDISAAGVATLALARAYSPTGVFTKSPLPETVRGIGMEMNDGDGWRAMDENVVATVYPGTAFKATRQTAGLGFGDGSTVLMCPDAVLEVTERGFEVRQGTLAVTVPDGSKDQFRLHFPERDIAVESGTMLAVSVEPADKYATGGAPAPVVKVLDGGMALAKGKGGTGLLLANHVYTIDNYVTPDLPGRPLCSTECQDLQKTLSPNVNSYAGSFPGGSSPTQFVNSFSPVTVAAPPPPPSDFVKQGSRWVAKSYADQPTVKLQYLSDEYFGFANERRDLSDALALGPEVVFDGGDGNFYEIVK